MSQEMLEQVLDAVAKRRGDLHGARYSEEDGVRTRRDGFSLKWNPNLPIVGRRRRDGERRGSPWMSGYGIPPEGSFGSDRISGEALDQADLFKTRAISDADYAYSRARDPDDDRTARDIQRALRAYRRAAP